MDTYLDETDNSMDLRTLKLSHSGSEVKLCRERERERGCQKRKKLEKNSLLPGK